MFYSIIIPTCNRNNHLAKCLDLLTPNVQNIESNDYEVIVSDDSKEKNAWILIEREYGWVKWIEGPKKGPAANRNNGAKLAKGDWLVFIDDDCIPDTSLLKNYKYAIEAFDNVKAFEGAVLPDSWELLKKDLSICPINTNGDCFWSANICLSKNLFIAIKGFDEDYLIAAQEDQQLKHDISNSLKYQIKFVPECIVIHPVRFTSLSSQIKKIPSSSRNFAIYAIKNRKLLYGGSVMNFAMKEYIVHVKGVYKSIKSMKIRTSMIAIVHLIFMVPLNIYNYLIMFKTYK